MKYFKMIVGEKVYLSPINLEDANQYAEWLSDIDIAKYLDQFTKIHNEINEAEWIKSLGKNGDYNFAIIDKEHDKLLGNISLGKVNMTHRIAELGVFIGDKGYLSKGYGSEAIMLLLDYGFNFINLNNIMLRVLSFNSRAIKAYEKCGFKTFGVWKECFYFDGKYFDEIYMNVLKKDFNLQKIKRTND